jgi:hypothetical protein
MTVTARDIYSIANYFVGQYMDYYAFQYSGTVSDLYNLGYFRGAARYVGGPGPWNDSAAPNGYIPGVFPSTDLSINDFYNTEGNCNCDCNCACDCACDCACACNC